MNNQYLLKLAKQILSVKPGPSKVQFAKLIYFVHKGLILSKLSESNDLRFIRMPLGPVPVGFQELTHSDTGIFTEDQELGLVYNAQLYFLDTNRTGNLDDKRSSAVKELVNNLSKLKTSELVEVSHKEPSWINRNNSEQYYISKEDLENEMPGQKKVSIDDEFDKQRLQGFLLSGMIDEVVGESSALEYPDVEK